MFANAYQNGAYFEIFDSKVNNEKNELYKQICKITPNNNKRYFDKEVKSYLWQFNSLNSRLILPADDHKQLSLHQRYLVLQIYIPLGCSWSLQIGLTDIAKIKRRINITTTANKQQTKYFSLRYPFYHLIRGSWMFLAIDVLSFMDAFKGQVFRSLDHIVIGSHCKIRRIFTLKQWNQFDIPKAYWLSGQLQQNFQLIEYGDKKHQQGTISQIVDDKISRVKSLQKKKTQEAIKSYQHSPAYPKHKNLSSLLKSPPKSNLAYNPMTKSEIPSTINSKIKINTLKQDKISINKLNKNNQKIHSKVKPPFIEKNFRQDQGLIVPPQQSDIPFDESHSKQKNHYEVIQQDKWSEEEPSNQQKSEHQQINQHKKIKQSIGGIFPSTLITKQNKQRITIQKNSQKQLELIYDQMVGCYYHPQTNTYYEINP